MFYVGKGKGNRFKNIGRRNKFFIDFYNTHNCDVRIVKDNLNEQQSFQEEIKLIAFYRNNTKYRLTNITDGGEGASGWKPSDELKKRQSIISKERWLDENYRKRMIEIRNCKDSPYKTEEFRQKISSIVSGKNNPNYKNKWTDEQKEHLSKIRKELGLAKGKNNPNHKKIICLETGEIFEMILEAKEKYNIKSETSISIALKERQRTAANMHWLYFNEELLSEEKRFNELLISLSLSNKYPVICIDTKELFYNRKDFLVKNKIGIKMFKKKYTKKCGIFVNNKCFMYVNDYISRFIQ